MNDDARGAAMLRTISAATLWLESSLNSVYRVNNGVVNVVDRWAHGRQVVRGTKVGLIWVFHGYASREERFMKVHTSVTRGHHGICMVETNYSFRKGMVR